MKRSEYEKKMADLQNQIEELKKVEIEEDRRWKPSLNERYYYTRSSGQIPREVWINSPIDNERYAIGNCFKTAKEAEFAVEKLKVLAELKEFVESDDAKWDGTVPHYSIGYDVHNREILIDYNWRSKFTSIYFASEKDAKTAIDKVGEERIKKYYLGIKEGEE